MELKNILWPTDFSEAAAAALPLVKSLTRKYDAEIHLLHVAEDLTSFEHYWGSGPDARHIDELNKYALEISRDRLQNLCQDKLEGCPRFHIHIVLGDPAREILNAVSKIGIDLVVMATHGMKAHFPFGSVAEKVVKNAGVPVLTITPPRS
jgi:nucleotide-binding universal stress UspA family protein